VTLYIFYRELTVVAVGNSLTRCEKCKAPVKDTDAVLDALRVGQEGLDKAEKAQFSGLLFCLIW
jgi:hypothetical protein